MKKRLIFGALFLSMFFAACFSIGVYARENTIVKDYAAADTNNNQLLPAYQQIQQAQGR